MPKAALRLQAVPRFGRQRLLSLNNGRAYFRAVSVVPVDGPVEGFPAVFHLDAIRRSKAGSLIGLAAAFALLAALACAGWYLCVHSGDVC